MPKKPTSEILSSFEPFETAGRLLSTSSSARRRTLRSWAEKGVLASPYPGLFCRPGFWDRLDRMQQERCLLLTLADLHPDWIFCSYSAAVLQGLSVSYKLLGRVHIARSDRKRARSTPWLKVHSLPGLVIPLPTDGARVTELHLTVSECLLDAPFRRGLAIADSALRVSTSNEESFRNSILSACMKRHGCSRARKTLAHADGRAESGGESMIRATIIELGFDIPELQVELPDLVDPPRTFRVDFLWTLPDGRRVIGEFDGAGKYERKEMTGGRSREEVEGVERQRESRLTLLGMPVVRFDAADLRKPALLARKLRTAGIPCDESRGFPTDPHDL